MENNLESNTSTDRAPLSQRPSNWLKIAFLTAGSVLAGGIAAAWWYRQTLEKLRESGENPQNSHFGISTKQSADGSEDEI
jgi:hypothetical protein